MGALLAAAACGPREDPQAADRVTVQLKWVHQAQFAGMYVAQEKGLYARGRMRVEFLEGGQGIDIADAVVSGKALLGVVAPEDLLISRSKGVPLTAIAAIYRRSAVVFLARADSGIRRPQDFVGKTIAARGEGGAVRDLEFQFHALMRKLDLDLSTTRIVPYDPEYVGFVNGEVHVTPAYATGGLIRLRRDGMKLNLIWPGDYGVHFYSDILVATEQTLEKRADLVTRFLRATLDGWREAVENPEEAVAATLKKARVQDPDFQSAMMDALSPLVHTGEDRIGWMRPGRWQEMYDVLWDRRILQGPFDVGAAYTMRFLEAIYGGSAK
jgi:NitT/TauT family transport system substrate-binding protein